MELQSRYESITELRTHIDDAKNMHRTNHAAADKIKTIHDLMFVFILVSIYILEVNKPVQGIMFI